VTASGPGLMAVREGRYAIAIMPVALGVSGTRVVRGVELQGDVAPGGVPHLLADMLLLRAGVRPPGLMVAQVVEA
jgi:hypothetical protein